MKIESATREEQESRLISFLSVREIDPSVYIELFGNLFSIPCFQPLHGDLYHAADHLFQWGFIGKMMIPKLTDGGEYQGMNVFFFPLGGEIILKMEDGQ